MPQSYLDMLTTPGVKAAQVENGSREQWARMEGKRVWRSFDDNARAFIAERDSFYMASNSASGWPYVQHRGGPPGFLKVLDDTRFGFADYRGNTQYITLGNAKSDDRVALFLMDYPRRKRLKILARLSVHDANGEPELAEALRDPDYPAEVERLMVFTLEAYDWNCPQHITPRFTKAMVAEALDQQSREIAALREENAALKARLEG